MTKLIALFEQFEPCAYPDPLHGWEVPTIGYGTTVYPDGKKVKKGDVISQDRAKELLAHWVASDERYLASRIPNWKKLNPHRKESILSFTYNLGRYFYGTDGFSSITALLDDPSKWEDESWVRHTFMKYRRGAELGLGRRRFAESQVWFGVDPETAYCKAYKYIENMEDVKIFSTYEPPLPAPPPLPPLPPLEEELPPKVLGPSCPAPLPKKKKSRSIKALLQRLFGRGG